MEPIRPDKNYRPEHKTSLWDPFGVFGQQKSPSKYAQARKKRAVAKRKKK